MTDDPGEDRPSAAKCPICGRPTVPASRPFCSPRCADVDLQRWFSGAYAIPIVESDEQPGDRDEEA